MLKSIDKLRSLFTLISNYRVMMKGSRFFDKNPVVQGRFEEIEDWVEELDTELDKLIEQNKLIKSKLEEIQVLLNDRLQ
jgi:hypothetical protein